MEYLKPPKEHGRFHLFCKTNRAALFVGRSKFESGKYEDSLTVLIKFNFPDVTDKTAYYFTGHIESFNKLIPRTVDMAFHFLNDCLKWHKYTLNDTYELSREAMFKAMVYKDLLRALIN